LLWGVSETDIDMGVDETPFLPYNKKRVRRFMSLISQKDREMVIEALEYYIQRLKKDNCTEASIYAYNTLLRWIELEYFKNEN
jgi:hypothetical protein